jgi:hypothetical protein
MVHATARAGKESWFITAGEMFMRVRNLRSVEKSLLAMAAIAIVWFGFTEEGFFPLPKPPIDPLTPLIYCGGIFVIYWLLARIYILAARRWG